MEVPLGFGAELRRLRQEAGITLQELVTAMNYSRGHLSKIEKGRRAPSTALARRCDAHFAARGTLSSIAEAPDGGEGRGVAASTTALRDVIATGTAPIIGIAVGDVTEEYGRDGDTAVPVLKTFQDRFRLMRALGQITPPQELLPLSRAQASTITALAARSNGKTRTDLLVMAARFAEYTGWVAQEAGDEAAALQWTADAVELADAGGDRHLAGYALVRRALVTFYNGVARETVALAQQAQRGSLPRRIRGLAAQQEAQGHALAGLERPCVRALERARELLSSDAGAAEDSGTPVLGTTHLLDPISMVTGWCLYDLGCPARAAEVLDRECRCIALEATRTRMRYGVRRTLAHAALGEIEHACGPARELLLFIDTVPSARVRADVRQLDRELSRFRSQRAVRELQPSLAHALGGS
ncbi:helix-turn-helix transcriptional regulator [Streptomyces sp. NPDC047315]|uniref:helix-turn-helix domain-containing protein n=1 Tax=Streptomyces sp. NPDC047315 TaxID=3155142 RepID=UPI0033E1B3E1